jgi:hypothetical protein
MKIYSNVVLGGNLNYPNIIGTYSFTRNMQNKVSESVSVLDFGAEGDGITNDTNAINRAIRNVIYKGGGQVVFPPGTYSISGTLGGTFTDIDAKNVSFEITGVDARIVPISYISGYTFYFKGDFDTFKFNNMTINGNYLATAGIRIDGFYTTGYYTPSIVVENCKIYDCLGVSSSRTEVSGIRIASAENGIIRNNIVQNLSRTDWMTKRNLNVSWAGQTSSAYWIDVSGISIANCDRLTITDNLIKDISHGNSRNMDPENPTSPYPNWVVPGGTYSTFGSPPGGVSKYLKTYDCNGMIVYNGTSLTDRRKYLRQQSIIANNTMIDCENRYIKLQTNGQCIIDNNIFYLGQDEKKVAKPLCGLNYIGVPILGATAGYPGVRYGNNGLFIDSQVGNAKMTNNKFYIDDWFIGGINKIFDSYSDELVGLTPSVIGGFTYSNNDDDVFSPDLVFFQSPTDGNINEPFESYFSQFESNEIYTTKTWKTGIRVQPPRLGSTSSLYTTIKNNLITTNATFSKSSVNSTTDVAHYYFVRSTLPYGPDKATGQWIMDISNNKVYSYQFISMDISGTYSTLDVNGNTLTKEQQAALSRDYSNNWTWHVYDNFRYPQGGTNELFESGRSDIQGASYSMSPFTSNLMARNNMMGDTEGFISFPIDLKKVLDGSDFATGGSSYFYVNTAIGVNNSMKNVPDDTYSGVFRNARIYKQGSFTYIDGSFRLYRSRNCVTWDYMNYASAINILSVTMSSENIV